MSEYQIIRFCAPTLAGLKTASLFCCDAPDEAELLGAAAPLEHFSCPEGPADASAAHLERRALIYLYRPKALARDLACEDAACLLNGSGYDGTEPSGCLRCLMGRLQCQKDGFPHEIGLFLGYPPEDVRGFIENETRNYKFTGYWKVYGDEERSRALFDKFERCTRCYLASWARGTGVERLALAV